MGIYVNQVGYLPKENKVAISTVGGGFTVNKAGEDMAVFTGVSGEGAYDEAAGEKVYQFDFSKLSEPGTYILEDACGNVSQPFEIKRDVYRDLNNALLKALYFQRCGCALEEKYAGVYTHKTCHTKPVVFWKDYINKVADAEYFDKTGGWHDAGDYGRYTTAGAVAVAHILYAYELFPKSFQDEINIPESGNGIPDVLNECLYELKWLLKMQSKNGGVYHKLTAFCHAPFIMPEEDRDQFLVSEKSSMATGDFAAVMALAYRIYKRILPDFAQTALEAARNAYAWLIAHPYQGFHNPEGSNTGEYGDDCDLDERMWAAAELMRCDKANRATYHEDLEKYVFSDIRKTDFGWADVAGFTLLSVLTDAKEHASEAVIKALRKELFQGADELVDMLRDSGYQVSMRSTDYVWGSNMVVCNRGMLLILAAINAQKEQADIYKNAAFNQLHYLLGRNALDRSYVTGFGTKAYKNPHNRPTATDNIELPMKGWVSGGPNGVPCDEDAIALLPKGTPPMKCHADVVGSYSTNEITIYWNSPALFMTAYFNTLVNEA